MAEGGISGLDYVALKKIFTFVSLASNAHTKTIG
jgi:hypothetical protein